jgi:hypothetical protein
MQNYNFIFSGGSITECVWPSWKNFVVHRYGIKTYINNAYSGVGNEYIVDSTINLAKKVSNPFVMVMLTNIDKWDWYVEDQNLVETINRNEKHPVRTINGNVGASGYWSTGSWFPTHKAHYKNYYYSKEYFIAKTLKNIFVLQKFLKEQQIPNIVLFDSPILKCTEQTICTGKIVNEIELSELSSIWHELIDWSNIYQPGLIGFCQENNLDWYCDKYKSHPPSKSHWEFAKSQIFPVLDDLLLIKNDTEPTKEINKFQKLFYL